MKTTPTTTKTSTRSKARPSGNGSGTAAAEASPAFKQISASTSRIVSEAAALLDAELAAGVLAAKKVQQRFARERRLEPGDFKEVLARLQRDAHEVVDLVNDQLAALRNQENVEHTTRLLSNGHDLVDLAVGLINMGAEMADELVQAKVPRKNGTGRGRGA